MRAVLLGLTSLCVLAAAKPPNVLFIVVDDLSPAFQQYGHPAITPNIGKLAAVGAQMQKAYVSMAVCAPSRTAFLTGLRPDTTQVWTIGPYFRNTSRGEGSQVVTLPQAFRLAGYKTTGTGKIFHPGTPSGGLSASEGGGDQCPIQSKTNNCTAAPTLAEAGSWSEPYWFCDQYTNDTVQSPAMQQWECSLHGQSRAVDADYVWPSCGGGCVQNSSCVACFQACGTWGKGGSWAACNCPEECYPEGMIAERAIRVLREKAADPDAAPWFHAVGFKRPHLSYRAPQKYFDMYDLDTVPLPKHRFPSPSAPGISYAHTCISQGPASGDEYGIAATLFGHEDAQGTSACSKMDFNRTGNGPFANESEASQIEIITNDTVVRELRRAYWATISLMDYALGKVLDELKALKLDQNTIITFIGDHGYQNGEKGEWCKSTNFELGTRIPMYVVVPPSLGEDWVRGGKVDGVVESVDLMVTLADLAGIALPAQAFGGESMRPLLQRKSTVKRNKTYALSQWPRRPSCVTSHGCTDGHGDPYSFGPDQAIMGYRLRVDDWAYVCWVEFDWGENGDPKGEASVPRWDRVHARELYTHVGDDGTSESSEAYEWTNLASDPTHADIMKKLHKELVAAVAQGLVKPVSGRVSQHQVAITV